jgi:hypothetical protein
MIDVFTGWSERRAVLGRSYLVLEDNFRVILARLPFPVQEIHPDNGGEFINQLCCASGESLCRGCDSHVAVPIIRTITASSSRRTPLWCAPGVMKEGLV